MIKRTLSKEIIEKEPWQKWNSFVDLLCMEEFEELSDIQKTASSIFWYNNEVENGGHMQYFLNLGIDHARQTVEALKRVKKDEHARLLESAIKKYNSINLEGIEDVEDYIEEALEDHFGECDTKFYDVENELIETLQKYLNEFENEFIEIK